MFFGAIVIIIMLMISIVAMLVYPGLRSGNSCYPVVDGLNPPLRNVQAAYWRDVRVAILFVREASHTCGWALLHLWHYHCVSR